MKWHGVQHVVSTLVFNTETHFQKQPDAHATRTVLSNNVILHTERCQNERLSPELKFKSESPVTLRANEAKSE